MSLAGVANTPIGVTTGPGAVITYLGLKSEQHKSQLDRDYVQSVFESNSVATTVNGVEIQKVTKGNAILAYEEIFRMWACDLDLQQEKTLKDTYFEAAWAREKTSVDDGSSYLELAKGYEFLMDLMTN